MSLRVMESPLFGLTLDVIPVEGIHTNLTVPIMTHSGSDELKLSLLDIQRIVQFSMDLATAQYDNDIAAIQLLLSQHRNFVFYDMGIKFIKREAEDRKKT